MQHFCCVLYLLPTLNATPMLRFLWWRYTTKDVILRRLRGHMFDRSHDILAMSFLGAMTALSCTPAPLRSPGNRTGLVALSAKTDSAFSRCAQAAIPIDTVT